MKDGSLTLPLMGPINILHSFNTDTWLCNLMEVIGRDDVTEIGWMFRWSRSRLYFSLVLHVHILGTYMFLAEDDEYTSNRSNFEGSSLAFH